MYNFMYEIIFFSISNQKKKKKQITTILHLEAACIQASKYNWL